VLSDAGKEWIVDALGCPADALRDLARIKGVVDRLIVELSLRPVETPLWHVFPGEAGVTGLVLLAESHVAVHTFPELGLATFNLYCCRPRAPWPWATRLRDSIAAREVIVREVSRGGNVP